jgi:E1A-binding protein p400
MSTVAASGQSVFPLFNLLDTPCCNSPGLIYVAQMFIYEEFMARSSTRQALRKGGNFMGMMNVLMQLRKVCNHPDLFEPRSVVTPMVVDPIILPMPSCVFRLSCSESLFAMTSHGARAPLWCGSCGEPSLEAALRHDTNESLALRTLEALLLHPEKEPLPDDDEDLSVCSTLRSLAQGIEDKEHNNNCLTTDFINYVCSRRCRTPPFVYPKSLLDLVAVSKAPLEQEGTDIMTTPSHLLAMRRNQQERANDLSELIRRFVFCVPKAGARPPVLATNCLETEVIDEALLNETMAGPLQECLAPFREAHARLSSYFPDKKLVQFDAGKLQALAELLRERKRGGHKVLIFTQMSKMLDILEDFLNLNGHTYLRLDGSTSVDRRQRLMDRFNNDPKVFCFILSTRSGGVGINLTGADTVVFYDSDWNPAQVIRYKVLKHIYFRIFSMLKLS